MKPLIKYTGGKYNEYNKIKHLFPQEINNYYEPFFGGGGVFFRLNGENKIHGKSHINDFSKSLIDFYKSVSGDTLQTELYKISDAWDLVREIANIIYENHHMRFEYLLTSTSEEPFVNKKIFGELKKKVSKINLDTHGFSITDKIKNCLNDKLNKFKNSDISGNIDDFVNKSITTSVCQAFYFVIRDMYNDWNNRGNHDKYSIDERSAQFTFIREFCFGSMFRFGSNGDFNVPYGGFSYNSKCFTCKIKNITSEDTRDLFSRMDIKCGDFEEAINEWKYTDNDFMFLDPPYDSTFSEYDNNSFGRNEHIRLANCLKNCGCKWLLAIGKTDFIVDLYKDYNIVEYDKTYMYQARGDYDNKHTTHLVIANYPLDTSIE